MEVVLVDSRSSSNSSGSTRRRRWCLSPPHFSFCSQSKGKINKVERGGARPHKHHAQCLCACARVRACVTERWRERERRALTLKSVPSSSSFFFVRHTGKESTFSCLWFPLTQQKVLLFFVPFFVSLLSFSPALPFLFFDLPYKKNHHSKKKEGSFFVVLFFFVCVCFFCLSRQSNTRRGSQNIFAQKRKRPPFFSLDSHKKHRKRSALVKTSRVLLSRFSL